MVPIIPFPSNNSAMKVIGLIRYDAKMIAVHQEDASMSTWLPPSYTF